MPETSRRPESSLSGARLRCTRRPPAHGPALTRRPAHGPALTRRPAPCQLAAIRGEAIAGEIVVAAGVLPAAVSSSIAGEAYQGVLGQAAGACEDEAEGPIPEDGGEADWQLDKSFAVKYDFRKEVGRGHFSHTCSARARKGEIKGQLVAVKIISTAKPCNRRR